MFQHILVPTDFSEQSKHALHIATEIAKLGGGRITLLHVIEMIADTTLQGELKDFYAKLGQQAREKLEGLQVDLPTGDVPVEWEIVYGTRVQEILSFAEQSNVDLIVMTSHTIDPENPTQGWGTISQKIGILAQCPVMLVK